MDVVLAVDTGGTKTSVLLQNQDGKEIGRRILQTHPHDYNVTLAQVIEAGRFLAKGHRLMASGIGAAGVIVDGVMTGSGNLPGWTDADLEADLQAAFDVPVVVMNDAESAAMGEYAAFRKPLIYVIWGTGVGAALVIVIDGRVVTHATELGHVVIDKHSRLKCGCGGFGHLEALVSGGNIPDRRFGLRRGIKAEHLNDRQWGVVLRDMAVGLRSISTSAPGLPIVMGGGVATKQQHRLPTLQGMVGQLQSSCPVPTLLLAKHGEDSGLMGAAYAAWQLVA